MIPEVLFKYVTIERAEQIIQNKKIRYTQPGEFNDAFELLPSLDISKLKADYLQTHNNLKGLDAFTLGVSQVIYDTYSSIGILCLSSRFDIPLMWGHYTGNYSGLVIGFDAEKLLLDKSENDENFRVGEVTYSSARFKFPSSGPITDSIFHKDKCWDYESEWRVIRSLRTLHHISDNVYVDSFPPEAIRCVIFGPRSITKDRLRIIKPLRGGEYSHVGHYIAYLNDSEFEIDIDYLSSTFSDESEMIYPREEYLLRNFRDKMLSKGQLFEAMEVIEPSIRFSRFKDSINLFTNEIK